MKKIGLIGEDPNDTDAIKNLLLKKFPSKFQFVQLIKNKKGYQLDNERVSQSLKIEYIDKKPNHIIFIRDVDGLKSEKDKINKVTNWFNKLNPIVENKGILLSNIYELEALILADIQTFNKLYQTKIKAQGDVTYKKEPKEFLMNKTSKKKKKYCESHCPEIFNELVFDIVVSNCKYFKDFVTT
jgi:hypothetical protein